MIDTNTPRSVTEPAFGQSASTTGLERQRFEEWAGGNIGRIWRKTEPGYTNEYEDSHTQIAWMAWINAALAEREACAKICDISPGTEAWEILGGEEGIELCNALASRIRERSNINVNGDPLAGRPR